MEPLFPVDPASAEGYVTCELGHEHWGKAGAAGLLLRSTDGEGRAVFLLQHRSPEVHLGDTWSVPGGALEWDETPVTGAIREVEEELTGLPTESIVVERVLTVDHGGWAYHTVVASCEYFRAEGTGWETGEEGFRWLTEADLARLPLHPGFAAALPELFPALTLLEV